MIILNKHKAGKLSNTIFGLMLLIDAVVRVGSLGFLCTTLPLWYSKRQAKMYINKETK